MNHQPEMQATQLAVNQQYSQCRPMLRNVKVLPATNHCANVQSVTAKSVIGIRTPERTKAQQDAYRPFLLPAFQYTYQLMAGLEGLPSGRPVPFVAGSSNLSSPVAISRFEPWVTGSKSKGARPMAIYRLALLTGNSARLCNRRVRGYISLPFNTHQQARKEASRLNAVVCGWNSRRAEA